MNLFKIKRYRFKKLNNEKIFNLSFFFITHLACAQKLEKVIVSSEDRYYFYLNDGDSTNLFYYKIVPKEKPVGNLVILPSSGETTGKMLKQITLHKLAYQNNILVILPSYNYGTIQRTPDVAFLDDIFEEVVKDHQVSKDNFVFCGLSDGGMISFDYAIRAVGDSSTFLTPKGIIGIDPPIDLIRFYNYCQREISRNFSPTGVGEAKWLADVYEKVFGGTPEENRQNYVDASAFTFGEKEGGNAKYLTNIGVRMYTDLDVDYLLNDRHRDLYDWNGIDIVAFVNQLKINGNTNAEVFISQGKGVRLDGTKHPHSWSIMNNDETLNWILKLFEYK